MVKGFVIGDRGLGASGDTHPDWMMAHAIAGPYMVVGASAIGQIHQAHSRPRDDAFAVRAAGSWLAVAVSDGVGSRPYSRYGAAYAVEALAALLLRPLVAPLSGVKQEPSSGRSPSPSGASPAPPFEQEEVELQRAAIGKGTEKPFLATLVPWCKKLFGAQPSSSQDALSLSSVQVASVGWQLALQDSNHSCSASGVAMKSDRTDLEKAGPTDAGAVLPNPPNVELIMDRAFGSTHLGLRQLAQDLGLSLSDLGCTALGLLLNTETGRGAVGQIGDGALLGLRKHGTVEELVTAPDTGDPQATYTLTRTDFTNYLKVQLIRSVADDPYVAFYVMTDGLSGDLLYSPRAEAVRAWAQKVDWNLRVSSSPAQAAGGLINWLATYQVTGSWDDRTLVAITQVERENGDSERATEQPQPAELHHDQ